MTGRLAAPSAFEIDTTELRSVLRLALELRDFPSGAPEQRTHFLESASKLIGAQVSMWLEVDALTESWPVIVTSHDLGWDSDKQRKGFVDYLSAQHEPPGPTATRGPARDNKLLLTPFTVNGRHLTLDRADYID